MSSRFVSKVRREIATNRKQAGVLALLLVVAIWFWIPLVAKWFGKPATAVAKASPATEAAGKSAGSRVPAPAEKHQPIKTASAISTDAASAALPTHPWRQLVTWIEHDPRTVPAAGLSSGRDPFQRPTTPATETKVILPPAKPRDATPADAGLVLTSTIVGHGQRAALIGGRIYDEGNLVPSRNGRGEFVVIEIRPRAVILEQNAKRYTLSLPIDAWAANVAPKTSRDVPHKGHSTATH